MGTLVELEELDELEPPLCLVDARLAEDYEVGHVPGALHLDTFEFANERTEGADLDALLRQWQQMFHDAGIRREESVVFYDAGTENRASRPALMLRALGHDRAHVLHGGMAGWLDAGGDTSVTSQRREPSSWARGTTSGFLVGVDAVREVLGRPDVVLLDVRSDEEWEGTKQMQGNPRLGRLPGARHLEWRSLIQRRSTWPQGAGTPRDGDSLLFRLHEPAALREKLAAVGLDADTEVMLYCQKSHRASVVFVALEALGIERARVYAGSFREWSRRSDLPLDEAPLAGEPKLS
ncbi:MAG: rhodanese-like domain-containing protein [Actinomycetota bacterium]|nr:rhodanese-like domain-containing protein [Actinomycetota bacterium]